MQREQHIVIDNIVIPQRPMQVALLPEAELAQQGLRGNVGSQHLRRDGVVVLDRKQVVDEGGERFGHIPFAGVLLSQPIGKVDGVDIIAQAVLVDVDFANQPVILFAGNGKILLLAIICCR